MITNKRLANILGLALVFFGLLDFAFFLVDVVVDIADGELGSLESKGGNGSLGLIQIFAGGGIASLANSKDED